MLQSWKLHKRSANREVGKMLDINITNMDLLNYLESIDPTIDAITQREIVWIFQTMLLEHN